MALWVVRAGRNGERESFALENNVAVAGWWEVGDLTRVTTREELAALMWKTYPDAKPAKITNNTGQLWKVRGRISGGDLIVLPLKTRSAIAIGKVTGPYRYVADAPPDARHSIPVRRHGP